jgi:hypothetical protein
MLAIAETRVEFGRRANPQRLANGEAIRFHADVREAILAGDGAVTPGDSLL